VLWRQHRERFASDQTFCSGDGSKASIKEFEPDMEISARFQDDLGLLGVFKK
jgi:hypothetical protein